MLDEDNVKIKGAVERSNVSGSTNAIYIKDSLPVTSHYLGRVKREEVPTLAPQAPSKRRSDVVVNPSPALTLEFELLRLMLQFFNSPLCLRT